MDSRAFLLGFIVAALLGGGVYYFYGQRPEPDPCRVCSTGTRCAAGLCVAANTPAQPVTRKRPGARPRPAGSAAGAAQSAGGVAPTGTAPEEAPAEPVAPPPPPPPPLRPEERKLVSVGDKLTGTEVVNLAESGGSERELSQEDIDAVFRPRQPSIVSCIDDARGEAQLDAIITVAFRIRRSGEVAGVRVEAPAYLISHGLNDCVRRIVLPLHFPASAKAQVVTYPFSLH